MIFPLGAILLAHHASFLEDDGKAALRWMSSHRVTEARVPSLKAFGVSDTQLRNLDDTVAKAVIQPNFDFAPAKYTVRTLAIVIAVATFVTGCNFATANTVPVHTHVDTQTWPHNPTPYKVLPQWSWDAKASNPKDPVSGSLLPDYGNASALDVNRHINDVWNACKHVRHIRGESITALSKRIQGAVGAVIGRLPNKPTEAEEIVLRAAGNETFIVCNVSGGDNPENGNPSSILYRNRTLSAGRMDDKDCKPYAQALLDLADMWSVCAGIATLRLALDNECHILSFSSYVVVRDKASDTAIASTYNPQNHAILHTCLPTKMGRNMTMAQRQIDSFNRLTLAYSDPTAGLLSGEEKENLDKIIEFPHPETCLIGAKGDDVFRVYAACHYGYDRPAHGVSYFRVSGFGEGTNMSSKPLPAFVDELFHRVSTR